MLGLRWKVQLSFQDTVLHIGKLQGYKDIDLKQEFAWLLGMWNKDLDYALQLINECIDQEPEERYYLDTKAWILYQMGKYPEAEETINLFIQNFPERYIERAIAYLYHIGKIMIATGDTEKGYDYLQKILKFREVEPYEDFMVEDVKSILASKKWELKKKAKAEAQAE